MPPWAQHGLSDFAPVGLNVWGVADGAPWQHVLPGCRSVLVIGSGGTTLWDGFLRSVAGKIKQPLIVTYHCDVTISEKYFGVPEILPGRWS